ncbi:hypothetical protein EFBL_1161 [Effusibacillus lacus]|uniref:Oxygen sensor histidine kinase NreB n=2 Tax=Effusibacillus lacus TaxID=1348429 RepID=A0A292YGC5_9BACL|nr:hypothetical protein EFBL_1161 [Effusibacillus lacus]
MYDELQKEYQTRANRSYGKDDIAISKDVSQLLIEAQEEEKIRIAQYLHDQILQSLIFLSRDLKRIGDNNPLLAEREKLDFLVRNVNDTIYEIREICAELYPSIIEDLGLREAIRWYVREIKEKRNVLIDWKYEMEDEHLLPFTTKVSLFRIIKELVNNALKHAEAETIQLSLVLKNDTLTCEISDDGKGIDVPIDFHAFLNGKHLGLVTVQKRIEHLGGSLSFHSAPGKGTRVSFELPVWSKEWEHEQAN